MTAFLAKHEDLKMKTLSLVVAGALAAGAAWAMPPTLDVSGAWQVRLGEAAPVGIRLPGTLGDAKLGPEATEPLDGALTPRRQYIGPAAYTRTVTVPEGVTGDYELFLERVMWKSEALWDGRRLGTQDSLYAPHVHPVPAKLLTPGEHTLTVTIDNSLIHQIGEKSHGYSDLMQTRWNGAIGQLLLRPANPLRQARVFAPCGEVVTVDLPEGVPAAEVEASIVGMVAERLPGEARKLALRVPGAKPWSEFDPQLYTLTLKWKDQEHSVRFGFRTIARRGNRLFVNGRPFFQRSNTDNCHFPLTGYPAMDKAAWLRILGILKGQGINHVRCHSWCVPQAAFDAADELGLFISPEIVWFDGSWMPKLYPYLKGIGRGNADADAFVHAELFRVLDAFGNAPSFFSLTVGNELSAADFDLLGKWMAECKAHDPRHLYAASSARSITASDDFTVTHHYPGIGWMRERKREGTDWDYEDVYGRTQVPTIAHEIGQWPVFPNFAREIPKYTGLLRPWNFEQFRERSEKAGVLRFNAAYERASLMTNRLMYKDEIESFLRTPSCNGLQLLGIQDYTGHGEALIGWFDSFYDEKPGAERAVPVPDYFAPVAYLARFAKYTWSQSETLTVKLVVHNYGPTPLRGPIAWSFPALNRTDVVHVDVPVGAVQEVGVVSIPLNAIPAPAKTEFCFGNNRWPLWVYPATIDASVPENVVLTDDPAKAKAALAQGKRVILDAHDCPAPAATIHSSFVPVYWSASFFAGQSRVTLGMVVQDKHPAFANFPTEDWQDWQWKHLIDNAATFRIAGADDAFTPLAMPVVDFHKPALAAALFETAVGPGRLLVSGFNLADPRPEARQLRRSLLDYAASDAFAPKPHIPEKDLWALFHDIRANLPPRPAEYHSAVAYVECAAFLRRQGTVTPWKADRDRAETQAGTVTPSGSDVFTWRDQDGTYWVGQDDLTITLAGCPNVRGQLLVRFRDANANGRTSKGTFDGNRTFAIPPHAKSKDNPAGAYWLSLPVDMEDFLDGKLELKIQKTSGPNITVDRVILMPHNK